LNEIYFQISKFPKIAHGGGDLIEVEGGCKEVSVLRRYFFGMTYGILRASSTRSIGIG
jgi:hypothetical protein